MLTTKDRIVLILGRVLSRLREDESIRVDSCLLGAVLSYGDTLDDETVLRHIEHWLQSAATDRTA